MTAALHRRGLLLLVAKVSAGEKLRIGDLARALGTDQLAVIAGLTSLIDDGLLDRQTLRPTAPPPPAPVPSYPTGASLAAELDGLVAQGALKSRVGMAIYNCKNGVDSLRRVKLPTPELVGRVRDLVADPPSHLFPARVTAPVQARPDPTLPPASPPMDAEERHRAQVAHKIQRSMRRNRREAQKAVDAGMPIGKARNGAIKRAMHEITRHGEETVRLADPFEQARLKLQRIRVVHCASVTGGRADRFIVSGCHRQLTKSEIIALADGSMTVTQINEGVGP